MSEAQQELKNERLSYPKFRAALADLIWRPDATDKELYAAFISGAARVAKENLKLQTLVLGTKEARIQKQGRSSRKRTSRRKKLLESAKQLQRQQQRRLLKPSQRKQMKRQVHSQGSSLATDKAKAQACVKLQVVELNEKVERMLKGLEQIDFNTIDEVAKAKRIDLNKEQAAKEASAKTEAAASSKASGSAATAQLESEGCY